MNALNAEVVVTHVFFLMKNLKFVLVIDVRLLLNASFVLCAIGARVFEKAASADNSGVLGRYDSI